MTHYPHRIRLRGPWECRPLGDGGEESRRVAMPATWATAGFRGWAGAACFTRNFGYPGTIDDHERVWLVCADLAASAAIVLNDAALAAAVSGTFQGEVTSILGSRNRVEITMGGVDDDDLPWTEVALEIRCAAYLSGLEVRSTGAAAPRVHGKVVGSCTGPLELYGIVDGRHVHYQTVEATEQGTPFEFSAGEAAIDRIRVELVQAATIWYAWETSTQP